MAKWSKRPRANQMARIAFITREEKVTPNQERCSMVFNVWSVSKRFTESLLLFKSFGKLSKVAVY